VYWLWGYPQKQPPKGFAEQTARSELFNNLKSKIMKTKLLLLSALLFSVLLSIIQSILNKIFVSED
jgi:hypothetical protein